MITLHPGDCLAFAKTLPDNCIDTIITDPPYGLNFMGKEWDRGVPGVPFWAEFLRISKPGAHLMAFGGTRTWHRLACAIEDAGWEIRDTVAWVYGSGFPKSLDISKAIDKEAGVERTEVIGKVTSGKMMRAGGQNERPYQQGRGNRLETDVTAPATDAAKEWDGWGTNLKPAFEPIILAMKPLDGTFAQNAQKWGVAGLNIDGSRIGTEEVITSNTALLSYGGENSHPGHAGHENKTSVHQGRWPANLIHDGSEEVLRLFPQSDGKQGDVLGTEESHTGQSGIYGEYSRTTFQPKRGDSGSAARFFFCAKASRSEREEGLEDFIPQRKAGADFRPNHAEKAEQGATGNPYGRWGKIKNNHATVKPLALMEYLCRLSMTPRGGVVFDPFMGSGTTGIACVKLGRDFIGCETDEGYFKIAEARIRHTQPPLLVEE